MGNKERIFIIIDGSNFYHRLKEVFDKNKDLLEFNYDSFKEWIAGDRIIVNKKYYIGAIRAKPNDEKSQFLRRNQQKLFSKLHKFNWDIERGYILNSAGERHEKGVDVHIAVDILAGAYEDLYDTIILISSDTDLIPALVKARLMKKKVEYIGFGHKPSYALIAHSDIRRLLNKDDIEKFFLKS